MLDRAIDVQPDEIETMGRDPDRILAFAAMQAEAFDGKLTGAFDVHRDGRIEFEITD